MAPQEPQTDQQKQWFADGMLEEDGSVIVQPVDWSDDHWYWYQRGVLEPSRLYADSLAEAAQA